jgi:hypothetical protein
MWRHGTASYVMWWWHGYREEGREGGDDYIMTVAWRHCIASLACIERAWHGVLLALHWDMAWLVCGGLAGSPGAIYISVVFAGG